MAAVIIAAVLSAPAFCDEGIALLLQQTPAQGGTITPDVGVHHVEANTDVVLTAVPKPGYQFVYWLGDVSEPTANTTIAYLDAPKIIIAVFERAKYEFLLPEDRSRSAPVGGLVSSPADYSNTGSQAGGAKRPHKWRGPTPPEEEEEADFPVPEEKSDFPVPDESNDFPVPEPVPEPATFFLLTLGGLALLRTRRL